jgi:DNA primase
MSSPRTLAAIKAQVDLVDVVGRHVKLLKKGRDLWGCCPFHRDRTPSLKVSASRYYCFGCQAKGDVLDFMMAHEGLNITDAIGRLRELGGGAERREPRAPSSPEPSSDRNRQRAQEIWRRAHPLCQCEACGPGRTYLASRGITRWPEAVFFHPRCPFLDVEDDDQRVLRHAPALIAPVNCQRTVHVVGVWRIRLTSAGEKIERRALGPTKGNASRLFWVEGDELAISEGVEDALAVHALTGGLPCWAALSAGNMAEMHGIPPWIRSVTIFSDVDEVGRRGAHALADRLRHEGHDARVVKAIAGKDANDVLLAGGRVA